DDDHGDRRTRRAGARRGVRPGSPSANRFGRGIRGGLPAAPDRPAGPRVTDVPVVHLTALVPVRPDRAGALRTTLMELPTGSHSPFEAVPGTHFARLVVV